MNKLITLLFFSTLLVFCTGCATIVEGPFQDFEVITTKDDHPENTVCILTNEEGAWRTLANKKHSIHRDENELNVECKNPSQIGNGKIKPAFQYEYLVFDLLIDLCFVVLSCVIDGATNAFFEYPPYIKIEMTNHIEQ